MSEAPPEVTEAPLTAEQQDEAWNKVHSDRTATPAAEPELGPDGKPDPLAGIPEPTRKLIEEIDALKEDLSSTKVELKTVAQRMATVNGMYGTVKQQLDASQVELKAIRPVVETVETQKKEAADKAALEKAARLKAEREKLMEYPDFPELLKHVDELISDVKPAEQPKPAPATQAKPEATQAPDPEVAKIAVLADTLTELRPDWRAKRKDPAFDPWLAKQPADIQAKFETYSVADAISVLDAFEKHLGDAAKVAAVEKERQDRLRRGEGINGRGGSQQHVDGSSPDALWNKVRADREKARAAG